MGCCSSSAVTTNVVSLHAGDEVVLVGLQNAKLNQSLNQSLNGSHATLVRWIDNASTSRDDGGRWLVELHLPGKKQVAVLPSKCRLIRKGTPGMPNRAHQQTHQTIPMAIGSHVRIVGTAKMDNSTGVIVGWLDNSQTATDDGGRWKVRLDRDGRVVALKHRNLVAATVRSPTASASRSVPLISPVSSQPNREDYAAAGGVDSALGSAFSTAGRSNVDTGPQVATVIAPDLSSDILIGEVIQDQAETPEEVAAEAIIFPPPTRTDDLPETPDWLRPRSS